jgi:hypothetical protein
MVARVARIEAVTCDSPHEAAWLERNLRHRPGQRRPDPGRRRRYCPVPRPQPLRVLDRHRPHRRLQRPAHPPPAVAHREPPPQPRHLHRRDRPAAPRHRRPRLLPAQTRRREDPMEAMRCLRRRLPDAVYRQLVADAQPQSSTGPGGHPGASLTSSAAGLVPGHRHFGSATSRTAHPTLPHQACPTGHGPRRRHTTAARPRWQRAAPHRTNDVDTGQRRRTLKPAGPCPLTTPTTVMLAIPAFGGMVEVDRVLAVPCASCCQPRTAR